MLLLEKGENIIYLNLNRKTHPRTVAAMLLDPEERLSPPLVGPPGPTAVVPMPLSAAERRSAIPALGAASAACTAHSRTYRCVYLYLVTNAHAAHNREATCAFATQKPTGPGIEAERDKQEERCSLVFTHSACKFSTCT